MRYAIILAVILTGCATPQQRAQSMLDDYGPICEALGFKTGTQEYSQCVLQSATAERQRRASIYQGYMASQPKL